MLFGRSVRIGVSSAMFQDPLGDFVLAGKPDALVALSISEEAIKRTHTAGVTVDPVMKSDQHHAATGCALFVELVELILEGLFIRP